MEFVNNLVLSIGGYLWDAVIYLGCFLGIY